MCVCVVCVCVCVYVCMFVVGFTQTCHLWDAPYGMGAVLGLSSYSIFCHRKIATSVIVTPGHIALRVAGFWMHYTLAIRKGAALQTHPTLQTSGGKIAFVSSCSTVCGVIPQTSWAPGKLFQYYKIQTKRFSEKPKP